MNQLKKKTLKEQFDDKELTGDKPVVVPPKKGGGSTQTFTNCSGTYTQGCKSNVIKQVQGCIGVKQTGNFGPLTQEALKKIGYSKGFKDSDVNQICTDMKTNDIEFIVTADKGI